MQTDPDAGALLREARPSWHLYGTYGVLACAGLVVLAWMRFSSSPWNVLLAATGLAWLSGLAALGLAVWGLGGILTLARWRLRLYERGLYQGPYTGRGGVFLAFDSILALEMDVVRLPAPLSPLIGHYRVWGRSGEIVLFPKLYRDIEGLVAEVARRAQRPWAEIRMSREA